MVPVFRLDELMDRIDFSNRWIYKGSMPAPDCLQYIYWNIIHKVYPIGNHDIQTLRDALTKVGIDYTDGIGNSREIQRKLNKEVYFIQSSAFSLLVSSATLIAVLL